MDFSDAIPCTGPAPAFSADKKHVACAQDYRVVVRDVETLAVVALFSCVDRIEHIAWSPAGDHLLCGLFKRATLQVFSVSDPEWTCTISEGLAGIVAAAWSPAGRHVLATCDFQVRLSVWSLDDQSCSYLPGPKHAHSGLAFNPDGSLLASLERSDCKDHVTLYNAESWQLAGRFALSTQDAAGLAWSPDGSAIAAWDAPAQGYRVCVHAPDGELLAESSGASAGGDGGLGAKSVAWSPSGQLLAVGDFDKEVRILNNATWSALATLPHPAVVTGPPTVVAYSEQEEDSGRRVLQEASNALTDIAAGRGAVRAKPEVRPRPMSRPGSRSVSRPSSPSKQPGAQWEEDLTADCSVDAKSRYVVAELPLRLPAVKAPLDKPNPRMGMGSVLWSFDGSYFVTRCDSLPTTVWVWDTTRLELAAVLVHCRAVRAAEWDPCGNRLALTTGSNKLYVWTPEGASVVHLPLSGFHASVLAWQPGGGCVLVRGRESFCCAYPAS